jgi:hypothetical protein
MLMEKVFNIIFQLYYVSGISFIRYAQSQKIGEPNNFTVKSAKIMLVSFIPVIRTEGTQLATAAKNTKCCPFFN